MTKFAVGSLLFLVAASGAPINSYAATPTAKEEYELQERCGKRAEESFKKEWGNGIFSTKEGQALVTFRNHYNRRLNKCFYLQTYIDSKFKGKQKSMTTSRILVDFNDNNEIGTFLSPTICHVGGNVCRSEKEWDALVAPFMND